MTAPTETQTRAPGIYDIPAHAYHADKTSLSSTGARKLLPPSCPAKFRYEQDNPPPRKKELDFGAAVHAYLFGGGPQLIIVREADWRSAGARAERDRAVISGDIALLLPELKQVEAMAAALREHPVAAALFAEGSGAAEKSLYWVDPETGITCRSRPDWLPHPSGGRLVLPDYKTTVAADDESIAKHIANYGYHQQGDWYLEGARQLGLADRDAVFVLVFQEKSAPYLVRTVQLDAFTLRIAAAKNARARRIFAECTAADVWPGYGDDVAYLSIPSWAQFRDSEEYL